MGFNSAFKGLRGPDQVCNCRWTWLSGSVVVSLRQTHRKKWTELLTENKEIIIIIIISSLVTGLFFLVILLNQQRFPPLRLQASHCSTFRIVCDVPSIAVFCSESIECFPGTASKFFLKLLVTIPVAPIITGIIVHFRFQIRCISIHKLLFFNFFPLPFAQHFFLRVLPLLSVCMFSFFCF